ncbi:MAG: DUF3604 domain-containing protein [Myxococcota bacterium]
MGGTLCLEAARDPWMRIQEVAEGAYDRTAACQFTSFVAYEWTATPGGNNLHRNIVFRNEDVPDLPVSYIEEPRAERMWERLDAVCAESGGRCEALSIPHNSNASGGQMFTTDYGGASTIEEQREVAQRRHRLERLMEIFQHKGSSECAYPDFSSDESCAFELIDNQVEVEAPQALSSTRYDFLRGALPLGLSEYLRLGVNPFELGVIASTDTHNSTPGLVREDDWPGHVGVNDADTVRSSAEFSPGGLVGVWAIENSRDAIFEAMLRRETFGTSGPRIQPRLFAGWGFDTGLCAASDLLERAYAEGVPMGATLPARPAEAEAPTFIVQAAQDLDPLERTQIVKVWMNEQGDPEEHVYDVAVAPDELTVDTATCVERGSGLSTACNVFTDPDFDPAVPAAYYVRVLEGPSCRWLTHACNALSPQQRPRQCSDPEIPKTIRERAWTSPVFYLPPGWGAESRASS